MLGAVCRKVLAEERHMFDRLIGKQVLVRSHMAGVWFGTLEACEGNPENFSVTLAQAAKVWSWEGAAATSGLALRGPGAGSKVCEDVNLAVVGGCCEILTTAPAATKAFKNLPPDAQPSVRRDADGLPAGLLRDRRRRLRALGNAVVPQQAAIAWARAAEVLARTTTTGEQQK